MSTYHERAVREPDYSQKKCHVNSYLLSETLLRRRVPWGRERSLPRCLWRSHSHQSLKTWGWGGLKCSTSATAGGASVFTATGLPGHHAWICMKWFLFLQPIAQFQEHHNSNTRSLRSTPSVSQSLSVALFYRECQWLRPGTARL